MTEQDNEENIIMINDCAARAKDMSDWECQFMDDIGDRADRGIPLSEKQLDKLNDIWSRIT